MVSIKPSFRAPWSQSLDFLVTKWFVFQFSTLIGIRSSVWRGAAAGCPTVPQEIAIELTTLTILRPFVNVSPTVVIVLKLWVLVLKLHYLSYFLLCYIFIVSCIWKIFSKELYLLKYYLLFFFIIEFWLVHIEVALFVLVSVHSFIVSCI